jgi:hypothetical protein
VRSKRNRSRTLELLGYLRMKKLIKFLVITLAIGFMASIMSSCSIFDESTHAQKQKSFKHTKPIPKKYVINNGRNPVLK